MPKISPVPQPAVPPVKPTPAKTEADEVKEETADAVKKVPKKRRLRTRYKVLFFAVLLVLAAFVVLLYNSPSNTSVPDVSGQTVAEARSAIEAKKLVV